jgi:hypothetical protein
VRRQNPHRCLPANATRDPAIAEFVEATLCGALIVAAANLFGLEIGFSMTRSCNETPRQSIVNTSLLETALSQLSC